ncbi:sugar porter family MFS transporter [Parachaetomium inaequale]|uniref:Sugar porter family MFS transporter n=1 Tax=Parachaetomium inaequale TaxID=2588326 RepID=A0AAN6PJM3_9PEZI|nr:sugar porter family MFS transporter [Parachaetomium inaequale]
MPPARATDVPEMEEVSTQGVRDTSLRANWRIIAVTLYIGISLFEYGFDKGAIAGFQAMPGFLQVFGYQSSSGTWNIQSTPQQIISSFMILGAFIGALLTGPVGAHLGRRHSMMLSSFLLIVATVIMAVTTSFGALYFSRLLCGIANGFLLNFSMVYLQESAPPYMRGLCFGVVTSWITIGTTIGMIVNKATADIMSRQAYQIPLYACFPAPAILILTLPFLPESPRWLLNHGRPEDALHSLRFLRKGAYDEVALQQEFEEMKAIAAREAETQKDWRLIFELFRGTNLRRTIICVGVGTANAGVGAMFILAFGTYFFKIAEVGDPFLWTIITNCVGLAGLMLTWVFVTRVGRRHLILTGCLLCTICMLIMAILYTAPGLSPHNAGIGLVVITSVYLFGFNFGLEPYVYLVAGELPAQNLRAYTMGLASGVSFVFGWICAFTTPYFINKTSLNWGPKYGYIWFVSGLIVSAFVYFMLPEVRGRTLEEIDEMFRNKVPTRQFEKYVCLEIEEARGRGAMNARAFGKEHLMEDKPVLAHVENASKV